MYRILIIEDDRGIAEAINEQAGMLYWEVPVLKIGLSSVVVQLI